MMSLTTVVRLISQRVEIAKIGARISSLVAKRTSSNEGDISQLVLNINK
jgi:hypothetical protein